MPENHQKQNSKDCKTIQSKPFISFFILFLFSFMVLSGLVIYFAPRGRVANWFDWSFFGLNRFIWLDIHLTVSIIFMISVIIHVIYNWKCLKGYIINRLSGTLRLKKELLLTFIMGVFIIISAIYQIPPISYVSQLRNHFKNDNWSARRDSIKDDYGWRRGRGYGGRGRGY